LAASRLAPLLQRLPVGAARAATATIRTTAPPTPLATTTTARATPATAAATPRPGCVLELR